MDPAFSPSGDGGQTRNIYPPLMKSRNELCRGRYLVSGVAVPHDQLSVLGGTDEKPAGQTQQMLKIVPQSHF